MSLSATGPFPASYALFTPFFVEPAIPSVNTELQGHFLQHKWDEEVSHITAGYWYNSASNGKVRVDETYLGAYGSSLFDYTNATQDGTISNAQIIIGPSIGSEPSCFDDYVEMPGFPLVTADFLISYNATFGGIVNEPFLGWTQTWNMLYGSIVPVTAYLDMNNTLMGYDFFGQERRTKVVTRFFAQSAGEKIAPEVFQAFDCSGTNSGAQRRGFEIKREIR